MTENFASLEDFDQNLHEENCLSCKYWASMPSRHCEIIEGAKIYYYETGSCKRYPPAIVKKSDSDVKRYPATEGDDYCGEYVFDRHYKIGVIHGETPKHLQHLFD